MSYTQIKLALLAVTFALTVACDAETIGLVMDSGGGGKLDGPIKSDAKGGKLDGNGAKKDGNAGKKDGNAGNKDGYTGPKKDMFVSPDVVPAGKKEICNNGFDDDKDGKVDENCGCKIGSTQKCFPLPQMTFKGPCKMGTQTCYGAGEFGKWGDCKGAVIPQPEICGDGYDQNCDGTDPPCPPKCPDGKCNGTETCMTCPQDCGKCCGNGKCEPQYMEDCKTCPADCGACKPYCGDGMCNNNEDCETCPKDCGTCPTQCDTFTFGINARAIDIAFIVDQSGSMSSEIAGVKANLNAFSTYIAGTKLDYHVIMLAQKGSGTYDICIPAPLGGAGCNNGPRYMQISKRVGSTNELSLFQSNITQIESFMRPNSLRQIVVITDDNSYVKEGTFQPWITARAGWSDYLFHSIVSTTYKSGCTASIGTVYQALTTMTKGFITDLCNANWNAMFTQLGKAAAGIAIKQYQLTKKPLNSKLTVTYNNVPKTQGTDFDYVPANNQVHLKGTLPANNTQIKVCYQFKP